MSIDAVVGGFYDAYNEHDVARALSFYEDDATHHEVAQGRRARGIEEIGSGLARFIGSFPDAHWEERRRVVGADGVAIAYLLRGTLAAPMGPFRSVGAKLELEGLHLLEISGERIAASSDYWDSGTFARQMSVNR